MSAVTQADLLRGVRLALQANDLAAAQHGLEKAALLARAEGDAAAEGRHLGNLALIHHRQGQTDAALTAFYAALTLARSQGDRMTEGGLLGNIGGLLREAGRTAEATEHLNAALLIAQEIGDDRGRGLWLTSLGLVALDAGRLAEAVDLFVEAVRLARQMGDQRGLAARLEHLVTARARLETRFASYLLEMLRDAAAIYRSLGDADGVRRVDLQSQQLLRRWRETR